MAALSIRLATLDDLSVLRDVMARSIDQLQTDFLSPDQITASHSFMGLDTQLVEDGTYYVVTMGDQIAGCGGWSRRATLYGGDHTAAQRNAALLDPVLDAARVRAMYTHPDYARRGVGRLILATCEAAAAATGFRSVELMATLSGEPLYRACGYSVISPAEERVGEYVVPLRRMGKRLIA